MGLIQPLKFGASQADWDSWMMALTQWASTQDQITTGLPVTKQGIDNLMQMAGSTSNAMLMYYVTSLPPKPSYSNQVVYNGEDGRIYAWNNTNSVWEPTGATAFDQLTGFVQSGQLLLGNQLNICTNGCFTNDTVGQVANGWGATSSNTNAAPVVQSGSSTPSGCPTANALFVQGRDTYFTAGNGFDVTPGSIYYLEGYTASDGSTPGMGVGLYFPAVGSNGPAWETAFQGLSGQKGWVSTNGTVVVPSWANRAMVWLFVNGTGSSPSGYGNNWFTGIECVKSASNLQTYSTGAIACPVNTATTILSGNFTTKVASVLNCQGVYNAMTYWLNGQLDLLIDGTVVTSRTMDINLGSTGGGSVGLVPFDVYGTVVDPGSHTFEIQVTNSVNVAGITYQIESMTILNLLK